jgi:hypothetical protein
MYFFSTYNKREIIDILKQKIESPHISIFRGGYCGATEILGKIDNNKFVIHRKRNYRQPAIPFLHGTFEEINQKTMITCYFDYSDTGKAMILLAFYLSLLLSIIITFFCIVNVFSGKDILINILYIAFSLIPVLILLFGSRYGKKVNYKEVLYFEDFFKNILHANKLDKSNALNVLSEGDIANNFVSESRIL